MTARFDYFVVLADMRTGSNFLEANLNRFKGLTCYGEAFNTAFIGYPKTTDILGITQPQRDADPQRLIDAIKTQTDGLGGFRLFSDHDQRALDICLTDPRCAKIMLTRNPVESFVSLQTARATGQWKLTDARHARQKKVRFDGAEFECYLTDMQAFQHKTLRALQTSGQTAFAIHYDDLHDLAIMNGLATFLGCADQIAALDDILKPQSPRALDERVTNPQAMRAALARLDRFDLSKSPHFEPSRMPRVPHYVAAPKAPLLFLPIPGGPNDMVTDWLSCLDDGAQVRTGFTRQSLQDWQAGHPGHRSFSVVRDPLIRAHAAFCDKILSKGAGSLPACRRVLERQYGLDLSYDDADDAAHRAAFAGFLTFLKANLDGQTSVRVDASWAGQLTLLQGMVAVGVPDMVVREARLQDDLAILCAQIGRKTMPAVATKTDAHGERLVRIVDSGIKAACRAVYQRDYATFGF